MESQGESFVGLGGDWGFHGKRSRRRHAGFAPYQHRYPGDRRSSDLSGRAVQFGRLDLLSDQILSVSISEAEGDGKKIIDQWSKTHSFVLVPFSIAVQPAEGKIPEHLEVIVAFAGLGDLSQQPIIIDTFPDTGFAPAAFQGNADLTLDAGAEFKPVIPGAPATANIGAEAKVALSYKYAPAYANVVAGFASGNAFWQFSRTQDKYPVGEVPLKMLIAVPKSVNDETLVVAFDVRARFSGNFWSGGRTVASYQSLLKLPGD